MLSLPSSPRARFSALLAVLALGTGSGLAAGCGGATRTPSASHGVDQRRGDHAERRGHHAVEHRHEHEHDRDVDRPSATAPTATSTTPAGSARRRRRPPCPAARPPPPPLTPVARRRPTRTAHPTTTNTTTNSGGARPRRTPSAARHRAGPALSAVRAALGPRRPGERGRVGLQVGAALGPAVRLLELGGQRQQRALAGGLADQLHGRAAGRRRAGRAAPRSPAGR